MSEQAVKALGILIVVLWFPFSIPLMLIGSCARLASVSLLNGWDITDRSLKSAGAAIEAAEKGKERDV
jgi:hypothetical protein